MLKECWMWVAVFVAICGFGGCAMWGFFCTKKEGFGPYTAGILLILLVVIFSALLSISGKLEVDVMANILLAVLGFAGGLFARNKSAKNKSAKNKSD